MIFFHVFYIQNINLSFRIHILMIEGYVYLMVEGDQYGEEKYKIGVTKNDPSLRLKKLKTGNSGELSLLKTYRSKNYKKIEKMIHKKYFNKRTLSQNEFFNLEDANVLNFIEDCKMLENVIDVLKENPFYK
ncbi:MAG: hypothetical protein EBS19_05605 [Spirochaetia bacterium]|nr:hypothetical protein [Spirochaetia bacterium]